MKVSTSNTYFRKLWRTDYHLAGTLEAPEVGKCLQNQSLNEQKYLLKYLVWDLHQMWGNIYFCDYNINQGSDILLCQIDK